MNITRRSFVKRTAFTAASVTILGQGVALADGECGSSGSPPPPVPLPDPDHGLIEPVNKEDGPDSATSAPGKIRVKKYKNKSSNGGVDWELQATIIDDMPVWTFSYMMVLSSPQRDGDKPVRKDCGKFEVKDVKLELPGGTSYGGVLLNGGNVTRWADVEDTSTPYKLLCSVTEPIAGDPDGDPQNNLLITTSHSVTPSGESAKKTINWTVTTNIAGVDTSVFESNIRDSLEAAYSPLKADATGDDDYCYEIEVNLPTPQKTDGACRQEWEVQGCQQSNPGAVCSIS